MADTKIVVTMVSGRKLRVVLTGVTPGQVQATIETAKTDGKMLLVNGKLIAPEHIETVEART